MLWSKGFVKATSYERVTDKSSFCIQEVAKAENLLKDSTSIATPVVSENYIGEGVECGDDIVSLSIPAENNGDEVLVCDLTSPIISYKVSNDVIEKIKKDGISNLVLSGWAKADAAWVSRHNNDYCGNCDDEEYLDIDSYKKNRRFELRAELKYLNNGIEKTTEQYLSFDWMNTEWQYCACPVTISLDANDELKEITVYFDYTNNTGSAKFFGMSLKEGSWNYSEFDNNLKTFEQSSNSKYVTYYKYDDNKKLEKTIIKDLISKEEFVTEYYYNDNGSLIKSVSFDGMVNEKVYNDKGSLIKSITYHKDEPANRFVSVNEYDDKGKSDSEFNDFGEKVAQNTYIDKTNLVETTTDMDGNKTSYGYDTYDDTLLQITTTVNNEVNSNTLNYTGNLLTGLLHNDIEINFTYDGFGNQTGVSLAGVDYLETEYQDIMGSQTLEDGSTLNVVIGKKATTTNALQEKFITYTDLDGNITQIDFVDKNDGILDK